MALTISTVSVTGTATAYTVPADKIAKVRLNRVDNFANTKTLSIGDYRLRSGINYVDCYSKYQAQQNNSSYAIAPPVVGFVRASGQSSSMTSSFLYIKEDHVLIAGETVSCNDSGATFAYTIFEEDA